MAAERARVLRALREEVERVVRELQATALQIITVETPVDTGFAKGSWTPSLGSPAMGTLFPPRDRGDRVRAGAENLSLHVAAARDIARTYQLAFGPVYISSNVPYIGRLNDGHSAKAPAMFVEAAIDRAIQAVGSRTRGSR